MIEPGTTFENNFQIWKVKNYDLYEDKFRCMDELGKESSFTENEILEGK